MGTLNRIGHSFLQSQGGGILCCSIQGVSTEIADVRNQPAQAQASSPAPATIPPTISLLAEIDGGPPFDPTAPGAGDDLLPAAFALPAEIARPKPKPRAMAITRAE